MTTIQQVLAISERTLAITAKYYIYGPDVTINFDDDKVYLTFPLEALESYKINIIAKQLSRFYDVVVLDSITIKINL